MREEVLAFRKRVLPPDHPDIATAMSSLATTHNDLRHHDDALEMKEEVLAFRKRVLPQDHPDIADAMSSLATTHSDFGRHADA